MSDQFFTRNRSIHFSSLVLYLLNFRKHSNQTELDTFFQHIHGLDDDVQTVTKSAFSQARNKLSHTAFIHLNRECVSQVYRRKQHLKTWKGFRLCAVDGSAIRLPEKSALTDYFGQHGGRTSQVKCTMGMASVFYDVMNRIVIDSTLEKNKTSERHCAAKHLHHSQENDLVLYDRGYPSHWFYQLHQQRNIHFCMRSKAKLCSTTKAFLASGKNEAIMTFSAQSSAAKKCIENGVSDMPIQLRLIRVELDNEVEVLITNLMDSKRYHYRVFKSLYHLRWGIEENYKRLKQWLEIENFSGQSVLAVKQDFYAKIVASNLTELMIKLADKSIKKKVSQRQHKYQINYSQALSKMKHKMVMIIEGVENRKRLIIRMANYISETIEAVRDGRSVPRKLKNTKNDIHYPAYKSGR